MRGWEMSADAMVQAAGLDDRQDVKEMAVEADTRLKRVAELLKN